MCYACTACPERSVVPRAAVLAGTLVAKPPGMAALAAPAVQPGVVTLQQPPPQQVQPQQPAAAAVPQQRQPAGAAAASASSAAAGDVRDVLNAFFMKRTKRLKV